MSKSIQLSQEELVYLLWRKKIATIPSLGPKPLDYGNEKLRNLALAVAERSLIARGLLVATKNGQFDLSSETSSWFKLVESAKKFIAVKERTPDQDWTASSYYLGENKVLEHKLPYSGVHHLKEMASLPEKIDQLLQLTESKVQEGFYLPPSAMLTVLEKASQSTESAQDYLEKLNIDQAKAKAFANDLASWRKHISLVAFVPDDPSPIEHNLFYTKRGVWLIQSAQDQSGIERLVVKKITNI
jgi:hypothetical protein